MREFATLPQQDRADALVIAARVKGMHSSIVEKDFWVCWTLDYLLLSGTASKKRTIVMQCAICNASLFWSLIILSKWS